MLKNVLYNVINIFTDTFNQFNTFLPKKCKRFLNGSVCLISFIVNFCDDFRFLAQIMLKKTVGPPNEDVCTK